MNQLGRGVCYYINICRRVEQTWRAHVQNTQNTHVSYDMIFYHIMYSIGVPTTTVSAAASSNIQSSIKCQAWSFVSSVNQQQVSVSVSADTCRCFGYSGINRSRKCIGGKMENWHVRVLVRTWFCFLHLQDVLLIQVRTPGSFFLLINTVREYKRSHVLFCSVPGMEWVTRYMIGRTADGIAVVVDHDDSSIGQHGANGGLLG